MRRRAFVMAILFAGLTQAAISAPADSTRVLLGSWSGRAAGPQGGPPTGDITVTFEKDPAGVKGKILVKAQGGIQYTGDVSQVALKGGVFSAVATFKLGENPLEANVTGPLKGRKIEGSFNVTAKGQKLGDGTFSITKDLPVKARKK